MTYDLRLADGKTVEWDGASEEDAARRYVGQYPAAVVVAARLSRQHTHGIFTFGRDGAIVEPGSLLY